MTCSLCLSVSARKAVSAGPSLPDPEHADWGVQQPISQVYVGLLQSYAFLCVCSVWFGWLVVVCFLVLFCLFLRISVS